MARSASVIVDWNVFFPRRVDHPDFETWSRYPLELDGANIVTPHLYAIRSRASGSPYACTIAAPAVFAVFAYRTPAHREYLVHEVAPRLARTCPHIALLDTGSRAFDIVGGEQALPLARLPEHLDRWTQSSAFTGMDFDADLDRYEQYFDVRASRARDLGPRLESSPLRLWEALFLRGHAYRYELIDNEVVLVGDLGTTLAANRSLLQCVRDAEELCRATPAEERDWIRAGRFRFRQREALLEIRVVLDAPDVRVAFAPHALGAAADALPSLAGVLVAGGYKGKTELSDGYTWASVHCRDEAELAALTARLAAEIEAWAGAAVDLDGDGHPSYVDGRWAIRSTRGTDRPLLSVFVPMYRDDVLPWDAVT